MAAKTYIVYNSAMATTAAPVKQATGTAIRTMMQLKPATGTIIRIIEWGCSFDGTTVLAPGQVELVETGAIGATSLTTAYVAADIQPWSDANAPANTAGTSGVPLNLGTSASGFSTGAVTEGSIVASRSVDTQLIASTNQYVKQFPLGREFECVPGNFLRVRATFGTTVNMLCYVIFEV